MSSPSNNAFAVMRAHAIKRDTEKQRQEQLREQSKQYLPLGIDREALRTESPVMGQPPTPPRARQGTVPKYNASGGIPMSKSHSRTPRQHESASPAALSIKPSGLKDYKAEIELKKSRVTELRTQFSLREAAHREKSASSKARAENKYEGGSYDNENLLGEYYSDSDEKYSKDELVKKQQQDAAELDDAIEQIDSLLREESGSHAAASTGHYRNRGYGTLKTQPSIQSMKAEKDSSTPEASLLAEHPKRAVKGERQQSRNFTGTTSQGGMVPAPSDPNYRDTPSLEQQMISHVQGLHHHMDSVVGRLTKYFEGSNNWAMDQVLRNMEPLSDTMNIFNSRSVHQNGNIMRLQQSVTDVCGQVSMLREDMRRGEESLQRSFQQEMNKLRRDLNVPGASSIPSSDSTTSCRLQVPGARVQFAPSASETPGSKMKYLRTKKEPEVSKEEKENVKPVKEKEIPTPRAVNKHAESHGGNVQQPRSGEQNILSPSTPHRASSKNTGTFYPQRKASILKNPAQASSGSPKPKQVKLSLDSVSNGNLPEKSERPKKPVEETPRNDEEGVKTPHKKGSMLFNFRRRKDNDANSQQPSTTSKFLRTPRRNKDVSTKAASSENLRKSAALMGFSKIGAPPVPPIPTSLLIESGKKLSPSVDGGRLSPGSIHPSMRNKRQQEIVDQRDRERARQLSMQSSASQSQSQSQAQSPLVSTADGPDSSPFFSSRSRQQMLRSSRSLHDFAGDRPSIASSSPSFAYGSPSPYYADRSFSSGQFFYEPPRFDSSPSSAKQPLLSPVGYQKTTPYGERQPEGNWV